MTDLSERDIAGLQPLQDALDAQRTKLLPYEQPSEPLTYEVMRTLDDLFLRDLMEPSRILSNEDRMYRSLSTWGVNKALRKVIPTELKSQLFKDFPSNSQVQGQSDDFIFNCAMLEIGERHEAWLREGIVTGEMQRLARPTTTGDESLEFLILRSNESSYLDEEIGWEGLRWTSSIAYWNDRGRERRLERRHRKLARELERHVELRGGWQISFTTTKEIDDYFLDWARIYLRRMQSQDLVGQDDLIGGRPFSRYVEVLTALSARSQKHIAFAAILRARHRSADSRNLLTTYSSRNYFVDSLSKYMDADRLEIEEIMASLVLSSENMDVHTRGTETAWAPVVRASMDNFILPAYGLDINPFLFLMTDLRARYEKDWFRIANNREKRWVDEMDDVFTGPRWQRNNRNLKLRLNGKIATDIDFAVLDNKANELAIFQLKWQHPIGMDNRVRRNAGQNLIKESNRWIEVVVSWLSQHGIDELVKRLGFQSLSSPTVHLFVLGRYHVYLSGFDNHDQNAVWSDWAHFKRFRTEAPHRSISQLASDLRSTIAQSRANKKGESSMIVVGDLPVLINPISLPER